MNTVLEFKNVNYSYKDAGKELIILDSVDFNFESGKFYTILGPSGSGKTTALSLASALDSPKSGEILYEGNDIKKIGLTNYRNQYIGIVFQAYNLINYMTGIQNIVTAMEITKNEISDRKQKAYELIEKVGLKREEGERSVLNLSGGQQQRVAIARALSTNAKIILADEPTGNLDSKTSVDIIKLFQKLAHEDDKCIIMVTHSLEIASMSDVIINLDNKKFKVK
ncbi:ABC transporter ATP-binding protein [Clostridium botulinum]|uniref:ABC transporter ATP-binding protein n=3 Tax=Clostridium botulinum TaxID=1491 RepID=A0A6B3Y1D1_CLOBO|nr:ABC transporter ATP-binding protein [Clostridium botulinum]AJD28123.1 ABC transporter family protein [Clostridium botulinum CDC_297]EPS47228.1 ABC transporter ATP-binding protein [Clostridium botulinum A1 str. CFSAN002368]ACQ51834.1 ABC transporter, ATP-binding protein [Clostridium botulinum Ba4 str. 657]AJE10401.1 ABC transporter family protein [Clostridium botulinum CDC_1436]APC80551.1 ABC transporter family protein [Clostridium botulinum]